MIYINELPSLSSIKSETIFMNEKIILKLLSYAILELLIKKKSSVLKQPISSHLPVLLQIFPVTLRLIFLTSVRRTIKLLRCDLIKVAISSQSLIKSPSTVCFFLFIA